MSAFNIAVIAAERGGFVRAAPLLAELRARPECDPRFVFAGEDYVPWAASELFHDLGLPYADAVIGASEGTRAERLARVMTGCERFAAAGDLRAIVLVGQSATMLGCAIACARSRAVVAHAEAGLRAPGVSGRTGLAAQMDRACGLLLAASEPAHDRLLNEGAAEERVMLAGTLAADAVARWLKPARESDAPARAGLQRKEFALAVVESPATIENVVNLRKLIDVLARVQEQVPVALCVHRRRSEKLKHWDLAQSVAELPHVGDVEPRGYVEFLSLLDSARLVLTDVGGVQDEATVLGVPCLTLAPATDRAATVVCGNNTLVGLDVEAAGQAVAAVMENRYPQARRLAAWDGRAAERIVDTLLQAVGEPPAAEH
jgi:UDP-N-acetylglucosamine 2-epimerase (non-hydrolysing)